MENKTKALIPENPLLVLPSLAKEIGLNEAIILQQIHFWLQTNYHIKEGQRWIYNSYTQWQEQFPFWSIKTIQRTILSLEKKSIIKSGNFNKLKIDRTKWYTINYENVPNSDSAMESNCPHQDDSLTPPLPETTTEKEKKEKIKKEKKEVSFIFNFWNEQKIIIHRDIDSHISTIKSALKKYSINELKGAIENLSTAIKSDKYWWTHKYTLNKFLTRKGVIDQFLTENDPLNSLLENNKNKINKATEKEWEDD